MADDTSVHSSASRGAETAARRRPFAPIFDTIVTESLSEAPFTSEEFSTTLPISGETWEAATANKEKDVGLKGSVLFSDETKSREPVSHSGMPSAWIIGIGVCTIVAILMYMMMQLHHQSQTITELMNSVSRIASSSSETKTLQERPWLNIVDLVPQPLAVAPGAFTLVLQNSGRTPALDTKISATAQLVGAAEPQPVTPVNQATGTLFAGSQIKTVLDLKPGPAVLAQLYRGRARFEIHLDVTYRDVLQAAHVSQACWSWQPAFRQMQTCTGYGTVN